jgi:ABC-2 type transport system permease protein
MIRTSLGLDLRRSRMLALWLLVVVLLYGGLIAMFYPTMRDNSAAVESYLKLMPKEFMAAFGLTGSLGDHGVFYSVYIGSMLWPVVAAIAAIVLGTRLASDADRGFLDLPLATATSRTEYLLATIVEQVVVLAVLAFGTVGGFLVFGSLVGAGFDAGRFVLTVPVSFAFAAAIAGVTSLVAAATLNRGLTAGLIGGVFVAMYLVQAIVQMQPALAWIGTFSAFHYIGTIQLIDDGTIPFDSLGILTAVALVGYVGSLVVFRRRDLAA